MGFFSIQSNAISIIPHTNLETRYVLIGLYLIFHIVQKPTHTLLQKLNMHAELLREEPVFC